MLPNMKISPSSCSAVLHTPMMFSESDCAYMETTTFRVQVEFQIPVGTGLPNLDFSRCDCQQICNLPGTFHIK